MAVLKSQPLQRQPRRIWRMTTDAPHGTYVDSESPAPATAAPEREEAERSWLGSSLELAAGVRVTETPADTLPGELFDALFNRG